MKHTRIYAFVVVGMTALTFWGASVFAQDSKTNRNQACITLVAGDNAVLEIVKLSDGAAQGSNVGSGANRAVILRPVDTEKWQEFSVTFKSSVDTSIKFRLSGAYNKESEASVYIDNAVGTGVEINNGDFETAAGGKISGWQLVPDKNSKKAIVVSEPIKAASGTFYLKSTFSTPVMQMIQVTAGKEVTITVSGRLAGE